MIINIEVSPKKDRRYRVYMLDGSHMDIGNVNRLDEYIDTGDKKARANYYHSLDAVERREFLKLKASRVVIEACLLNGASTNIIKNINYLNEILAD